MCSSDLVPGSSWVPSHSEDIIEVVEHVLPILLSDVGGEERNDLGLILDASQMLEKETWRDALVEKSSSIQDERLLDLLQS